VFTVEQRERVHRLLVERAHDDARITAAAVVGSRANGGGDACSDLDLAFGLAPGAATGDVLADWTAFVERELGGFRLFDLPYRASIYRVFLLPGHLQLDLSFTPGGQFGALGPRFKLLFGAAVPLEPSPAPSAAEALGLGVHHALRARFCIERGRAWQAEWWISGARDQALALACLRHGLEPRQARGWDDLPADLAAVTREALVRSLERAELTRALGCAVEMLAGEAALLGGPHAALVPMLRDLAAGDWGRPR